MESTKTPILTMAATYIGTVVGAGFASGQEVLQFFGLFGINGIPGVIGSIAGLFVFGFACIEAGRQTRASTYKPVLAKAVGRTVAQFLDVITIVFLFTALSAMISGAGSVITQEFGLPWIAGAVLMAVITFITVLTRFSGVVHAIGLVVPFLLAGVVLIAVGAIYMNGLKIGKPPPGYEPPISHWAVSSLNYVSYNIFIAAPVLSSIGGTLNSTKQSFKIAFIGALGLGLGLSVVYLSVVSSLPHIASYEIPLAKLASQIWKFGRPLYVIIFLAEVYTTAVANLFSFSARLIDPKSRNFLYIALTAAVASLWAASAGFSNLVRAIYPICGWAGSIFVAGLVIYMINTFVFKK